MMYRKDIPRTQAQNSRESSKASQSYSYGRSISDREKSEWVREIRNQELPPYDDDDFDDSDDVSFELNPTKF